MRVLVAGAAGFVGSHLCDRLVDDGFEVLAIDNLYTGRRCNLDHLVGRKGLTFLERDINDRIDAGSIGEIDIIFNLACPASPPNYQLDPIFTLDTNYIGVKNLLELAVAKKSEDPPSLDERSVRRPRGASAGRVVLGKCQLFRDTKLL